MPTKADIRSRAARVCAAIVVVVGTLRCEVNSQLTNFSQLHTNLCAIGNCKPATPVLSGIDAASVVSPGGEVVLQGAHFNAANGTPGQIVLKMGSKFPLTVVHLGAPSGVYNQPYVERQLTVLGWADSHVFGQIPGDITGVIDGPATLEVWRSDGSKSASLTVHFVAARDLQVLPISDVTLTSCANAADGNLCNQWSDSSQMTIPAKVSGFVIFSIYSQHTMFLTGNTQQQGIDKYSFNLKNGWSLDNSYQLENGIGSKYACSVDAPTQENFHNFAPNASTPASGSVWVTWRSSCNTSYAIALHVTGPVGVPWK